MAQTIPVPRLIRELAPRYGIDPAAALAVARGEGGLVNRADDIGDLAGGGSYGPFQLYTKGALPAQFRGNPQAADAWAWSPAGIDYALRKMNEAGAGGLTGAKAVETIIRKFERPADPDKSVRLALGRLGTELASGVGAGGVGRQGEPVTAPTAQSVPPAASSSHSASADGRRAFATQLLAGMQGGKLDTRALLGAVQGLRQSRLNQDFEVPAAPLSTQTPSPSPEVRAVQEQTSGGINPDFARRLGALVAASGGRLKVTSGYRSPEHQARLYTAALTKYGSEKEARKWVAPPGKSKHNHGLAADLSGDLAWAHANAARFGLHFPLDNEDWHIEPVGSRP